MARLIDADKLFDIIDGCVPAPYEDSREAKEECLREIADAPTVDAAPVVRCKDCKWYDPAHIRLNNGERGEYKDYSKNDLFGLFVTTDIGINIGGRCMGTVYIENLFRKPEDFCSRGERKDGDGNG